MSADQQGWDWFALQLSDGSDLMFYRLRRRDGSIDPHSAGTWLAGDEEPRQIRSTDIAVEVLRYWDSPAGGRYPMAWRIGIDSLDLDLTITPVMDAQELHTTVRYWEGAVDVSGTADRLPVSGRGYVELTGYSRRPGEVE